MVASTTGILIVCDSLPNFSLIRNGGVCGWVVIDMDDVDEEGVVGRAGAPFAAAGTPPPPPLRCTGQCEREASDELHEPVEQ